MYLCMSVCVDIGIVVVADVDIDVDVGADVGIHVDVCVSQLWKPRKPHNSIKPWKSIRLRGYQKWKKSKTSRKSRKSMIIDINATIVLVAISIDTNID